MLIEQRHVDDSGFRGMPLYHTTSLFGRSTISSVARGGGGGSSPPIGLWSMQNRTFLVLLRPIFGEKLKTVPPKGNWVPKLWSTCRNSAWKSVKISDLNRKNSLNFGEDLFFFYFGNHLFLGWKNVGISELPRNSVSIFGQTVWFWFKSNENSGQGRLQFSCSFKKAPPPPFPNPGYVPEHNKNKKKTRKTR